MGDQGWASVASTFGVVEIALIIDLQSHREFVEMLGNLVVRIESFVEVHFSVSIKIMETYELVAASYEDLSIHQLYAEWLKQPRGYAIPLGIERCFVGNPLDAPNIAIPGAELSLIHI